MNNKLIGLAALLGLAAVGLFNGETHHSDDAWEQFKGTQNKVYKSAEIEKFRKSIFEANLAKIEAHNANPDKTYTMGVNQFTDLTQAEFEETYLRTIVPRKSLRLGHERTMVETDANDIDWVSQGKVSPVKNQGQCGSCWAFSATGAIESAYLIKGQNVLVSEQQLVDCSRGYGNMGCNGGWMDQAFDYVIDHGLKAESEYPYTARDQTCSAPSGGNWKISSYKDVAGCDNLANALASQPVSVAVDAGAWSGYRGGVFSQCGTSVNHGVLLVGMTGEGWKIKNSWGGSWGENGFIRLAPGNTCAVCSYPSFPIV